MSGRWAEVIVTEQPWGSGEFSPAVRVTLPQTPSIDLPLSKALMLHDELGEALRAAAVAEKEREQ